MRMTSRDKELLFLAISFGIVAVSWLGGAGFINRKTEEVVARKEALQIEYDDRMRVLAKKEQYLKSTKDYNDAYTLMLSNYPAIITQDRQILFVTGLEERFGLEITSVNYTDLEEAYVFQSVEPENETPYSLVSSVVQIPVELEYSQWKELIDYVFSFDDKNTVPQVTAEFDTLTGKVMAQISMNQYAVLGQNQKSEAPVVTVPVGTDNIFKSSAALSYDGGKVEQMEDIKKNYDCYVMLYPAASDVKAKVVAGQDEREKVISESNEEETLVIKAEEQDGSSSLTYTLGSGRPRVLYDIEGDTLDIYVLSSPRMGSTDLSSVKVQIDNQTAKKMRIAIVGDDSQNPRFTVESQNGNVDILK